MTNILTRNKYSSSLLPVDIQAICIENIKKQRKMKKLSQQALAKRSGVSLGSIKRFERSGEISFSSLLRIAHVLGQLENFVSIFEVDESLIMAAKKFDI